MYMPPVALGIALRKTATTGVRVLLVVSLVPAVVTFLKLISIIVTMTTIMLIAPKTVEAKRLSSAS